jgi:DNA-binding MarR family transcriptional regulator
MSNTKDQSAAIRVLTEIGIIHQLSQNALERTLPDGLRMAHFGVLTHFMRRDEPQSPTYLAHAFQVTKGAMTNTLTRLSARGLVHISADPRDGRAKLVCITEAGKAMHRRALTAITPFLHQTLSALSQEEFDAALPFLIGLRETLDQARD